MTNNKAKIAHEPRASAQKLLSLRPGETLTEALQTRLEEEILTGTLRPGMRLDEQEVAQRFGVSRTPVREAFRLLASNGLLELRGRQGAVIAKANIQTLVEMFQVMAELEGLCARLAARRISSEAAAALEEIHARLLRSAEEGAPELFYNVNLEFHEAIYDAAHNVFLAQQTRALRNRVAAYRRQVTYMPGRMRETLREHGEVVKAILGHDGDAAHLAMRGHVALLGDALGDFIATFR
jgi:DNA-binding GntR family transcriptional regulator